MPDPLPHQIWILWLGALCTFAIYTVLYRENPIFRFFEHVFIGVSMGYMIFATWRDVLAPRWWTRMTYQTAELTAAGKVITHEHQWLWILALFAGLMFYFIYSRRLIWIARIIMGFFFGWGAGYFFRGFFPQFGPQVSSSFKPLFSPQAPYLVFNHWVFLITLVAVMSYFIFSLEHRGRVLTRSAHLGRWLLMVGFGALFGTTIMGRLSLFIDRLRFLFSEWLGSFIPWFSQRQ